MESAALGNPKRIDGLIVRTVDGTLVLSDPGTGNTLITNRVGGRIVELADGSKEPAVIADALCAEFPAVDREKIYRQVGRFIEEGMKRGLLMRAGENGGTRQSRPSLPVLRGEQAAAAGDCLDERERERRFHPHVYWYLTFKCNLSCAHCAVSSSPWVDTSNDLDTGDCLRVVEQMAEMNAGAALLSGGEVLIRPDALTILRALGDHGISIGLETNGLRFDQAFVDLAKDLQAKGLLVMTISVDGGTKEAHEQLRGPRSFDRTVRGLRLLAENGIRFDIQCVLNSVNYKTIPQFYDLAAELSPACKGVLLGVLNAAGRGAELMESVGLRHEHLPEVFELVHQHKGKFSGVNLIKFPPALIPPKHLLTVYKGNDVGCSTSCQFPLLGVLPNGDITVCALGRTEPSLCFGNVRTMRLREAWQKARMDLLRSRYVTAEHLTGICADCVWKHTCKGSCRAWAYLEGEGFDSPYPVCQQSADAGCFPDEYRLSRQRQEPRPLPGA